MWRAVANAVLLRQLVEIGLGLVHARCRSRRRPAVRQPLGFEQRHVDAGGREDIGHDAADRAAADDGNVGLKSAPVLGIGRTPGGGNRSSQ